jgi:hypothetical protein
LTQPLFLHSRLSVPLPLPWLSIVIGFAALGD